MPSEDYHKAMRQGLKEVKAAQALGEETGPRTLPDAPEKLAVEEKLLPSGLVPSTVTADPAGTEKAPEPFHRVMVMVRLPLSNCRTGTRRGLPPGIMFRE